MDTMLSNRPIILTLVARLENGNPADGLALAQALISQIRDQVVDVP